MDILGFRMVRKTNTHTHTRKTIFADETQRANEREAQTTVAAAAAWSRKQKETKISDVGNSWRQPKTTCETIKIQNFLKIDKQTNKQTKQPAELKLDDGSIKATSDSHTHTRTRRYSHVFDAQNGGACAVQYCRG